ncbi:MAG TPA: peptide chain release factor N(5)-glutamine methyltransferase [Chthoniobacteraceae bacterium]|nr:peptide chain release factor N(5)-glutamine methyltransferase [Chthoniobacteraceae bacterium]
MSDNVKTVLEVIQSTTAYFTKHGIESPRLNSEHLTAHVLGKKRIELYMEFDRPLFEKELAPLREMVKLRAQGRPLQHLLGTVDFHGLIFKCDGRALVPRPETEQLVEILLAETAGRRPAKVLDVGTGSGVIALTLAAKIETASVDALDISEEALALARENAERLGLAGRVNFSRSDLLGGVTGSYDLIAANLPYIATGELASLSREVQCDPRTALEGGAAGHEIVARLIAQAKGRLASGGLLALEIGHDQADFLADLLGREKYQDILCKSDYQGVRRFLLAKYG